MSYVFWKRFACGVYLAFWDVVFVTVKNYVGGDGVCSMYISWWLNDRETASVTVVNCVQFAFL